MTRRIHTSRSALQGVVAHVMPSALPTVAGLLDSLGVVLGEDSSLLVPQARKVGNALTLVWGDPESTDYATLIFCGDTAPELTVVEAGNPRNIPVGQLTAWSSLEGIKRAAYAGGAGIQN